MSRFLNHIYYEIFSHKKMEEKFQIITKISNLCKIGVRVWAIENIQIALQKTFKIYIFQKISKTIYLHIT